MCSAPESDDRPGVPRADSEADGLAPAARVGASAPPRLGDADPVDPRARAAWRTWLSALATDADAAVAAALAYESLDGDAREAWLDVLEQDAPGLDVPLVALYAPLLSVESDERRRSRMASAIAPAALVATSRDEVLALRGVSTDGSIVSVVVSPVYLQFVEVLACRYTRDGGFLSVEHAPLRHVDEAPTKPGSVVLDVALEETPIRVVVEELAHAILAERRANRALPRALVSFVHIFGPDFEDGGALGDRGKAPP